MGAPAQASDPTSNTKPSGLYACKGSDTAITDACMSGALADVNAARAKEGLGHLLLPSNFRRLSISQQLFVLTNIERVDRGLWPVAGVSSRLISVAASGVDAMPQCNNCGAAANWASTKNPFWTHFLWMYDDGPNSPNSESNWGHRHNILINNFPGPLLMGAAIGTSASGGTGEVFEGGDTTYRPDVLTWTYESAYFTPAHTPTLHLGASGRTLAVVVKGHSHTTVKLQRWNGSLWVTLANYTSFGTPLVAATWSKGAGVSAGQYRVVAMDNTRYSRVYTGTLTVR